MELNSNLQLKYKREKKKKHAHKYVCCYPFAYAFKMLGYRICQIDVDSARMHIPHTELKQKKFKVISIFRL